MTFILELNHLLVLCGVSLLFTSSFFRLSCHNPRTQDDKFSATAIGRPLSPVVEDIFTDTRRIRVLTFLHSHVLGIISSNRISASLKLEIFSPSILWYHLENWQVLKKYIYLSISLHLMKVQLWANAYQDLYQIEAKRIRMKKPRLKTWWAFSVRNRYLPKCIPIFRNAPISKLFFGNYRIRKYYVKKLSKRLE